MTRVHDWPHSSFHRDVRAGLFPEDWAGDAETSGDFGERRCADLLGSNPPYELLRVARKRNLATRVRQINTTGKSLKTCPALRGKIFASTRRANQFYDFARLTRQEGRIASRHERAVGCGGRRCHEDERGGSVRRSRVVLAPDAGAKFAELSFCK